MEFYRFENPIMTDFAFDHNTDFPALSPKQDSVSRGLSQIALVTQDHLNRAPVFPRTMWKMNARLKDPLEMEANGWKEGCGLCNPRDAEQ